MTDFTSNPDDGINLLADVDSGTDCGDASAAEKTISWVSEVTLYDDDPDAHPWNGDEDDGLGFEGISWCNDAADCDDVAYGGSNLAELEALLASVGFPPLQHPRCPDGSESWADESFRILGEGACVSNDTRKTGLNNNDLIIGPTGAGKTRSYIKPNLLQNALPPEQNAPESFIITDTKGNLLREVGPALSAAGYEVMSIDFANVTNSTVGYNPLDFVRTDAYTGQLHEQDVLRIAHALCPLTIGNDPFWDQAACTLVEAMIAYAVEWMPKYQHNLGNVFNRVISADSKQMDEALKQVKAENPESLFVRKFSTTLSCAMAEKMLASIVGVAAQHLSPCVFSALDHLYCSDQRIDFRRLATGRCALFLTVSDTDRSMDKLVNLLYAQAMNELCRYADELCPNSRLPMPVRLYLDDFAASAVIPDFDNITSVIRSRGIAVSIVLQSLTQLEALYGTARARTIVNNCAHILYLGGHDLTTANYIAALSNCLPDRILKMPVGTAFLYEDGAGGRLLPRYRLEDHPAYAQLPEAAVGDWQVEVF
ncbi:type IV secretory system conjugative DNA transfer family protein [Adlercreutzia sp. R21]|uniref:VirD4-like conjugal transfer protein, CD1115 family n=1 Tax=Adlercreutzia wanghongyangiae TaxID=3111451 RepID=UPI002DB5E08A|nr:type IV secretory system conjugative DNA transfer family protein [Adlercreutzia sp. R21]MEC4185439.1 type IV secretory system conjugative DNA transfer family protein [Adlercreutzia sp. R21]